MGRYDEALEQAKRAVELRPDFGPAHWVLARAYESLNRLEDAHRHFTLAGDKVSAALIRAREGDRRPACALLEALRGSQDADLQLQLASLHAGLGNREEGVAALESAAAAYDYRPSHMTLMYLAVDRRFAPFRDDPRFRELVARLGLPRRW